jgi:hypothetical protein
MLNKLSAISKSYTEVRESSVCVCHKASAELCAAD